MEAVSDVVSIVSMGASKSLFREKFTIGFMLRPLRLAAAMKLIPITLLRFVVYMGVSSSACVPFPWSILATTLAIFISWLASRCCVWLVIVSGASFGFFSSV